MLNTESEKSHIKKWVPDIPEKFLNDFLEIIMSSGLTCSQESPKLFWTVTKYESQNSNKVDYVLDPTYHAMIEIAYKSGLQSINGHIVKECDIIRASSPSHAGGGTLYWESNLLDKNRVNSNMAGVYTIATLNGAIIDEFLGMDYLNKIYSIRKNKKDSSPWAKWTDEMYLKTGIRHIFKKLPSNSQMLAVMGQFDKGFDLSEQVSPAKEAAEAAKKEKANQIEIIRESMLVAIENCGTIDQLLAMREIITKEAPQEIRAELQKIRIEQIKTRFPDDYAALQAKYSGGTK